MADKKELCEVCSDNYGEHLCYGCNSLICENCFDEEADLCVDCIHDIHDLEY